MTFTSYEEPAMDVICFDLPDVITASGDPTSGVELPDQGLNMS